MGWEDLYKPKRVLCSPLLFPYSLTSLGILSVENKPLWRWFWKARLGRARKLCFWAPVTSFPLHQENFMQTCLQNAGEGAGSWVCVGGRGRTGTCSRGTNQGDRRDKSITTEAMAFSFHKLKQQRNSTQKFSNFLIGMLISEWSLL